MDWTASSAAALLAATVVACGRSSSDWPGRDQAEAYQEALATCLDDHHIAYQPVVARPSERMLVVPPPVPDAWWAAHGGYGLVGEHRSEVELDLEWEDPNQGLVDTPTGRRRTETALYGPGGTAERFSDGSCHGRALRAAGHLAERRAGTGRTPGADADRDLDGELAADPEVAAAHRAVIGCLRQAGHDPDVARDPRAELERRFTDDGVIDAPGRPSPDAGSDAIEAAADLEVEVALDDVRCRAEAGLDAAVDRALDRLAGGS